MYPGGVRPVRELLHFRASWNFAVSAGGPFFTLVSLSNEAQRIPGTEDRMSRQRFENMLRIGVPREIVLAQAAAAGVIMEEEISIDKTFLRNCLVNSAGDRDEKHDTLANLSGL